MLSPERTPQIPIQIDAFGRTTGINAEFIQALQKKDVVLSIEGSCAARRRDRLGARHLYFEIRGSQHDAWGGQLGPDIRAGWRWLEHRCARILAIGARFPDEVG